MKNDTYFKDLFYDVIRQNPNLLNGLKIKEDTEKIYTPLGHIDKKELNQESEVK